jgi:hypothetical protein
MTADVLIFALLLVPAGLAVLGLVLVYRYRERLKERSQYLYDGLILGGVILGAVISGVLLRLFISILGITGILIMLAGVAMLGLVLVYRHREQLKERSQYIYYGSMVGIVILFAVVSYILLPARFYPVESVSGCSTNLCVFVGGLCTLVSITAISGTLVGFSLLYMFRGILKEKFPYVFYGSIGFIFLVGVAAVLISMYPVTECPTIGPGSVGVTIDQNAGDAAKITMVDPGNLDSWGLVGPDGTRSTMADFGAGARFTLRSNDEVIRYLNSPENNITVFTTSGTKAVENVGELPSEYQRAPEGLIDPDADIGNYANASVATVACLITHHYDAKVGERQVPANVTLPCNTPVLAQNDSVNVGTSVKPTSGPNAGKTLVSPIIYREDEEYSVIGTVDGEERVLDWTNFTIEGE